MVWFGDSFGWMLDVGYMPGLPLPEGDHCRLLVPGFDMANHDPRSHNDAPPPTFPPLTLTFFAVDRLAGTGRTHTILEAYNFLTKIKEKFLKSSRHLELNQKSWNPLQWTAGWSCCLDRLRRLWQRWRGGHWKRFFSLVGKLKENCVEKLCCFFSNTLCLQVESHSPNAHFVDESFDFSYLSQVCIFYERAEPWQPSIGKNRGFLVSMKNRCCITWRNDVGCLVNPRRIIAYFFGLLLSLDFSNLMCHRGKSLKYVFCFSFSKHQKAETWSYLLNSSRLDSVWIILRYGFVLEDNPFDSAQLRLLFDALKTCSFCETLWIPVDRQVTRWPKGIDEVDSEKTEFDGRCFFSERDLQGVSVFSRDFVCT